MGKPATPRQLAETEAKAYLHGLKVSPRKLNLVAQTIRGKSASVALHELAFSRKRIARDVRKVLQSAIANAENNHQLDVDRLVVKEASVGRAFTLSRELDTEKISADLKDGVLTLRVPKAEHAQPRRIEVRAG